MIDINVLVIYFWLLMKILEDVPTYTRRFLLQEYLFVDTSFKVFRYMFRFELMVFRAEMC